LMISLRTVFTSTRCATFPTPPAAEDSFKNIFDRRRNAQRKPVFRP
jgi:hypothetical protein